MTTDKQRLSYEAEQTQQRGYDVTRGTHGTVTQTGEVPTHVLAANDRPGEPQVFPGLSDASRAYYTSEHGTSPEHANSAGWQWARSATNNASWINKDAPVPRSVVHNVEPEGDIDVDKNLNKTGRTSSEMTAPRLKVTGTEWIRPPAYGETHVQGTLPHMNWNQFSDDRDVDWNNRGLANAGMFDAVDTHAPDTTHERDQERMRGILERTAPAGGVSGALQLPGLEAPPKAVEDRADSPRRKFLM